MKEKTTINPVMLKVHVPIVIIGAMGIAKMFDMAGFSFMICMGFGVLFEVIYIVFIQTRIEQAKNWIPVRSD